MQADHFNGIQPWKVNRDGSIVNALFLEPAGSAAIVLAASATALAQGPTYRMGTTPSAEEIKARDTVAFPQGRGLPAGSGG